MIRRWDEIPPADRISRTILESCNGAVDPKWVHARLHAHACAAAVRFAPWLKEFARYWQPCQRSVLPGERFCSVHGGAALPKQDRAVAALRRALGKKASLDQELRAVQDMLAAVTATIAILRKAQKDRGCNAQLRG